MRRLRHTKADQVASAAESSVSQTNARGKAVLRASRSGLSSPRLTNLALEGLDGKKEFPASDAGRLRAAGVHRVTRQVRALYGQPASSTGTRPRCGRSATHPRRPQRGARPGRRQGGLAERARGKSSRGDFGSAARRRHERVDATARRRFRDGAPPSGKVDMTEFAPPGNEMMLTCECRSGRHAVHRRGTRGCPSATRSMSRVRRAEVQIQDRRGADAQALTGRRCRVVPARPRGPRVCFCMPFLLLAKVPGCGSACVRLRGGGHARVSCLLRFFVPSHPFADESAPRGSSKAHSSLQRPLIIIWGAAFNLGRQGFQVKTTCVIYVLAGCHTRGKGFLHGRAVEHHGVCRWGHWARKLPAPCCPSAPTNRRPWKPAPAANPRMLLSLCQPTRGRCTFHWAWGSAGGSVRLRIDGRCWQSYTEIPEPAGPSALRWLRL